MEGKIGEEENTDYLETKKSFSDEIKSTFLNFSRAIIQWKKKNNGHKL